MFLSDSFMFVVVIFSVLVFLDEENCWFIEICYIFYFVFCDKICIIGGGFFWIWRVLILVICCSNMLRDIGDFCIYSGKI